MPNTHYYAIVGDMHVRGRRAPAPLTIDQFAGQRITVVAPPSPPAQVNTILRGTVSGSIARIVQVLGPQEWIVQSLPGPYGVPGLAFGQHYNLAGFPSTGETITLDTGGTAVVAPLLAAGQSQPGIIQFATQHNDSWLGDFVPADQSDTVWLDWNAKRAQTIDVSGVTGTWSVGDRVQTSAGGSFTILHKPTATRWAIVRKAGTALAAAQTLTNLTSPGGAATIAVVGADPARGTWCAYTVMPNGTGINPSGTIGPAEGVNGNDPDWEFPRNGNGTDGREASVGPENRLIHRAHAFWQLQTDVDDRATRFLTVSSMDDNEEVDGLLGGVSVQVVRCTGAFAGGWVPGETVTGPGGWSATVHGHSVANKMVFVVAPNGATLAAGPITGGTSGATATADGAAHGWQPGSTHFNSLVHRVVAALSAPGALWLNGSGVPMAPQWEGIALMVWDSELLVHSFGCPPVASEVAQQQWVRFLEALRALASRPDLPIAVWKHRIESRQDLQLFGVPVAQFTHTVIDALPGLLPRVVVVDSAAYEMAAPQPGVSADPHLWLTTDSYVHLGDDLWRALSFGNTAVEPGDWRRVPIVFVLGADQACGFMSAQRAMELDLDPDLWPSTTFPIGVGVDTTDPKCLSWNTRSLELQPLHAGANANGFWGTDPLTCGFELPIMSRFKMRVSADPDESDRCVLAKFAVPGSSLNAAVPGATATWDPDLATRPEVTVNVAVTALAATSSLPARGRLTAAAGMFTADVWPVGLSVSIRGSALGVLGVGGNNTAPYRVATVRDRAGDGSWIEVVGPFVNEASRPITLTAGPPPLWPELRRQIDELFRAFSANRMIPDPRLVILEQGEADLGLVDEYEAALRRFWAALEPLLGMRGKGESAIAKCVVLTTEKTPVNVPDDDVRQLREIQARVGTELANSVVVDPSKLPMEYGGFTRRTTRLQNGLRFSARGMVTKGFMVDAAIGTLGPSKGIPEHPKGELDGAFFGAVNGGSDGLTTPTALTFLGGATALALGAPATGGLVVEDGSGVDNAESLCSVETFHEFWDQNNASAAVTGATDVQIAAALRRATREWVVGVCRDQWRGQIQYPNQRLPFPRVGCRDDEGRVVPQGTIPWEVVQATCLVAGHLLEGGSVLANGADQGPITRETKKGAGFEKTVEYAQPVSGGAGGVTRLRAAEALVATYMRGGSCGQVGRS